MIFRICCGAGRKEVDRFEYRRADLPVGDELEADLVQLVGVFSLDLSVDRSKPLECLLQPRDGELVLCLASRVFELAVHDPVGIRESCSSVVVGKIDYLLAVTEVGVFDGGTLNVNRCQL
ncbi:hypothetical protein SK571_33715 [Lentzea sp. BCCO 10_0798]|uniref:Uncharacterized protein n=1 Tax=Lentzea kristufekii TaxID=3095430 RepID=A0ABU4U1A5_9PSEU|nr:hypothetical protein [Lentzea sp. BCCO 10_0798]MDX8054355.1 hypothetical protein [Lentzea sp. BCCO 10_0798]